MLSIEATKHYTEDRQFFLFTQTVPASRTYKDIVVIIFFSSKGFKFFWGINNCLLIKYQANQLNPQKNLSFIDNTFIIGN